MSDLVLSRLNEYMAKIGETPTFESIPSEPEGAHITEFKYRIKCRTERNGSIKTAQGCGASKKAAKRNAAETFMQNYIHNTKSDESVAVRSQFGHSANTSCTVNIRDCILHNVLQMLCEEFKLPKPAYADVSASGPSHAPSFTFKCQVHEFRTDGSGGRKQEAKLMACKKMIALLMDTKQFYEIFESPQLRESENSNEVYCFRNTLKGPQEATPIGIFGRRKLRSILPNPPLACVKLSGESPIPNGIPVTSKIAIKVSNNNPIFEISKGICKDSDMNTNLIDFEDNLHQISHQNNLPMKTKCKSLNNLSDCVDKNGPIQHVDECIKRSTYKEGQRAMKQIDATLLSVEKQLYREIFNTIPNSDPTIKTVELLSCSYRISISSNSPCTIVNGKSGAKCTDQSIRIACLAKLLQNLMEHMAENIQVL